MIRDLDTEKAIEKKIRKGDIGAKRKKRNHDYYLRNAITLKERVKIRRRKTPPPIFEVINGKLVEFFRVQHIAQDLGMTVATIRLMENKGILMPTPFKGKDRGKGHDRLYPRPMRELIKNCFDAARTVCGKKKYTDAFRRLLKRKWIEAEIDGVW